MTCRIYRDPMVASVHNLDGCRLEVPELNHVPTIFHLCVPVDSMPTNIQTIGLVWGRRLLIRMTKISRILTCTCIAMPCGLCCIQSSLGGCWRSPWGKMVFFQYPMLSSSLFYKATQLITNLFMAVWTIAGLLLPISPLSGPDPSPPKNYLPHSHSLPPFALLSKKPILLGQYGAMIWQRQASAFVLIACFRVSTNVINDIFATHGSQLSKLGLHC